MGGDSRGSIKAAGGGRSCWGSGSKVGELNREYSTRSGGRSKRGASVDDTNSTQLRSVEDKLSGIAIRWNVTRGFGLINPRDGSENVFCHHTEISDGDMLQEGESVTYELGSGRKGRACAKNVTGGVLACADTCVKTCTNIFVYMCGLCEECGGHVYKTCIHACV